MTDREESVDERMSRLARATEPLRPRPGFERSVMAAIQAEALRAQGWLFSVVSASRRGLVTAALAAAAGLALAAAGERSADESLAASYTEVSASYVAAEIEMEIDW